MARFRKSFPELREAFVHHRANGEHDKKAQEEAFDQRVVALTDDTNHAVEANQVWVKDGKTLIVFKDAKAFAAHKIFCECAPPGAITEVPNPEAEAHQLLLELLKVKGQRILLDLKQSTVVMRGALAADKTVFITDRRFCPDPLPEGGEEMLLP